MLKFNDEHKNIIGSIQNNSNKFRIRNLVVNGILISSIFLFSGCQKNKGKDIFYAYNRINNESFYKLVISNNLQEKDTDSTISYIKIDDEEKKLIDFENSEGLYRISSNEEKIKEIISSQKEHIEYEYKFSWKQKVEHIQDGKVVATSYVPKDEYLWTTDANKDNLTGQKRIVSYGYYAYKVVLDEDGNYKAIKSDVFDNFKDLPEEFTYIKSNFYEEFISNIEELSPKEDAYGSSEVPNNNRNDNNNGYENKIKLNRM